METQNPVKRAEPGGEPGGGGGPAGVFDADAAVYCILAGEDTTSFNNYFNEQQRTSAVMLRMMLGSPA